MNSIRYSLLVSLRSRAVTVDSVRQSTVLAGQGDLYYLRRATAADSSEVTALYVDLLTTSNMQDPDSLWGSHKELMVDDALQSAGQVLMHSLHFRLPCC